jgi:hypothetical protein
VYHYSPLLEWRGIVFVADTPTLADFPAGGIIFSANMAVTALVFCSSGKRAGALPIGER